MKKSCVALWSLCMFSSLLCMEPQGAQLAFGPMRAAYYRQVMTSQEIPEVTQSNKPMSFL